MMITRPCTLRMPCEACIIHIAGVFGAAVAQIMRMYDEMEVTGEA